MACVYYYKGHKFNSELALDDFLIETEKYIPILGDIVFSTTEQQNPVLSRLKEVSKNCEKLKAEHEKYRHDKSHGYYDEDGDDFREVPPYIGVNRFLAQQRPDGSRFFPEFKDDQYWSRRRTDWKQGKFNEKEREWFGLDENYSENWSEDECKTRQKEIVEKWEYQAKTGTAIHEIFQLFFSRTKNDAGEEVYVYELPDMKQYIINNISAENKPFLDLATKDIIEDAINYATQLRDTIKSKYGEKAIFFPEFAIDGTANEGGKDTKLYGIIDLLVVDEQGNTHIIDYKTSVKEFSKFDSAKQAAYRYQMATYQRMLSRYGINTIGGDLYVAPIQILDFKKEGDKYSYSTIDIKEPIKRLNSEISQKEQDNIDLFMPPQFNISITTKDLMQNVSEHMGKRFADYSSTRIVTREQVIKELKEKNLLVKNDAGLYSYKPGGSSQAPITSSNEAEFIDKVLKYKQTLPQKRLQVMGTIKGALKEAIAKGDSEVDWPLPASTRTGVSVTWLRDTLSPYCNDQWKVEDNSTLESFGIITLINEYTHQVDFIRISTSNLTYNYRQSLDKNDVRKNRLGLTGQYEPDVVEQSNSNSLMAVAANGNIEIMEMMMILNLTDGLENSVVGNLKVINPYDAKSVQLSNEQALYCFNKLDQYDPLAFNKFNDGRIKLASKFQLTYNKFKDIMARAELHQWKDEYAKFKAFKSCISIMDQAITNPEARDAQLKALQELLKQAENDKVLAAISSRTYTDQAELSQDWNSLHNLILISIADLKGINFRQQLTDHKQWLESAINMSGNYLDNPGNLSSETLNLITRLVTEAYQNTRDEMQISKNKIRAAVEKLKKAKGFDYLKENIGFNQADLYKDMFVEKDGDLFFKNLNELSGPDREFLEFALEEINKNRHSDWTDEIRKQKRDSYDPEYYRVPLARGSNDSLVSSRGLLQLFRDKLTSWTPKNLFKRSRERLEGVYESLNAPSKDSGELIYKMTNIFDAGNETDDIRKEAIAKIGGIFNLERNMETLLLKHDFAYIQQRNMNNVFPLIKAATIHLAEQGANQNDTFKQDLKYVEEYIKNKVFNKSIVNPENQGAVNIANMVKRAASLFTLAFSPVQMLYQPLQGLWQDISLMIRKPDGRDAFTFQHFKTSLKMVYSELFDYSGKPTMCSLLNEVYGINDMDMNTYVDRISRARKGLLYNFDNFAFKFASRPDYYNRMSIFLSQMQGDGVLEAHSVVNGRLKYDWKLDKRFEAFANGRTSDPKYNEQRSLYYAMAQQFVNEHAMIENEKGEMVPFILDINNPMPLPRAYTNKQAESMKSLGDDIYGYYSHEKKSMIMSTAIGSMWLQFKTYWSGKKNQYLQKGGVRLRGNWEQYQEKDKDGNIVKYYYQTDSSGKINYDKKPLTEKEMDSKNLPKIAPVMQWKGQWQEGILVTMGDILVNAARDPKNALDYIKQKWNTNDDNLRTCYQSNIKQLGYDLLMFMIIGSILAGLMGDWLKELKEDNKDNTDLITGLQIAGAQVATMAVKNSFLDLNFIDSIGSPLGQWTPFAVEWTSRQYSNIAKVATGDEDIWDGIVNIASVNKQIKPVLDSIKPEQFRTKREGGTWESATARKNREKRENA